jgi:hypothetical protein
MGRWIALVSVCMNWKYASEAGRQLNSMLGLHEDGFGRNYRVLSHPQKTPIPDMILLRTARLLL